jgi:hypothetical protein
MIVCDKCQKRNPRRRILVKDVQYDKSRGNGKQYDLCEQCFQKTFKEILANQM